MFSIRASVRNTVRIAETALSFLSGRNKAKMFISSPWCISSAPLPCQLLGIRPPPVVGQHPGRVHNQAKNYDPIAKLSRHRGPRPPNCSYEGGYDLLLNLITTYSILMIRIKRGSKDSSSVDADKDIIQ